MKRWHLVLLLTVVLAGCWGEPQQTDLPGVYAFAKDGVRQEITIDADGSYTNSLYRDGALVWSDKGRWEYGRLKGKPMMVTFEQFRNGVKDRQPFPGVRGFWAVEPERSWRGAIVFCFDLDLGHYFERVAVR
jgi:hypothetical protein